MDQSISSVLQNHLLEVSAISQLHESIKNENFEEIKEFIRNFPYLRECKKKDKGIEMSALELAFNLKKLKIFALLRANNFYSGNEREFLDEFTDEEKEEIENEIRKIAIENPEAYIGLLMSKVKFNQGSPTESLDFRRMLVKLNKILEVSSLFFIAIYPDFQIFLDYTNEMVNRMKIGNTYENTLGLFEAEKGHLYVGRNGNKNQRYGTFAHELCHLVLWRLYENRALPYCEGDIVRKGKWDQVVSAVKRQYENDKNNTDNIIKWVFTAYTHKNKHVEEYLQSAESAVRVCDILAFYHNDQTKVQELQNRHPELFDFILNRVVPDLQIPHIHRFIKLNNEFGLTKQICESKLKIKPTELQEILNLPAENNKKFIITSKIPQLALSNIYQEVQNLPGNKLNLKGRNLFINSKLLNQKNLRDELESLIETGCCERVIVDIQSFDEEIFGFLKSLNFSKSSFYFVTNEKLREFFTGTELNFTRHEVNFQWEDLSEETKEFLLDKTIKFQNQEVSLSRALKYPETSVNSEILAILCSDEEIKINITSKSLKNVKFIPRVIQKKKKMEDSESNLEFRRSRYQFDEKYSYEDFLLVNFLKNTTNDSIIVISDMAGSGKTTLLKEIHKILTKDFKFNLTYFVGLLDHLTELKKGVGEKFTEFIAKILKFNELERGIFMQKFSNGEVKILFDAFDEISPKCKENTLKLFKNFQNDQEKGKNQIFITTRTHLEQDLETELIVLAHKIKVLTREEQVEFLVESWSSSNLESENSKLENKNYNLKTENNLKMIQNCANLLVDKINEVIKAKTSIIGLPLIVQGLGEVFKGKINENFKEEIQQLDISSIYEKIVEKSLKVLSEKFPEKPVENQGKEVTPKQVHQYFAIRHLFSEDLTVNLGLFYDKEEWDLEELARCGLIKYENEQVQFCHETYAEFFVAQNCFNLFKIKKLNDFHIDFLFQILTDEKFKISRMFLDSMLDKVENIEKLNILNSSEKIAQKIESQKDFLVFCAHEGLLNLCEILILIVEKLEKRELLKEVLESEKVKQFHEYDKRIVFLLILSQSKNMEKFELFFKKMSKVLDTNFLLKKNKNNESYYEILHYFVNYHTKKEIMERLWKIIENQQINFREFLLLKAGMWKKTALLHSIQYNNEICFYFFIEIYLKIFTFDDLIQYSDEMRGNFLYFVINSNNFSMIKFTLEKFKHEENLYKSDRDGRNLLHCAAAQNENIEAVEFLVNFIKTELGSGEVKRMLSEVDKYNWLPLHCAVRFNIPKVFQFFFSLYIVDFEKEEIEKILFSKDNYGYSLIHLSISNSKEMCEIVWEKFKNCDEEKIKELLLLKEMNSRTDLLHSIGIFFMEIINSFYFLFEIYLKFLTFDELIQQTDEDGENFLHYLAMFGSVSMLKLAFEKLKSEENFLNSLKVKNIYGWNLLHCAALKNKNKESVEFLVNFLKTELGSEEVKRMLSEVDKNNWLPLHCAVIPNIPIIFEFFFSLYVENFRKEEIEKILIEKVKIFNKNLLELAGDKASYKEMFETVKSATKNYNVFLDN